MTKRGNQLLDVDNFKREHELLIMKFRNQKPKKLTITKVINKIGLLKGLKDIYFDASLNELVNKINNLPYKDELFAEEDYIKKCLDGNMD